MSGKGPKKNLPTINFRPLLFCALGLAFGIFLLFRVRFGGFRPSDLCFLLVFLVSALFPLEKKRIVCVLAAVVLSAGVGCGAAELCTRNFLRGKEGGDYTVSGTVVSVTVKNGYSFTVLSGLTLDGAPQDGKMQATLSSEEVRLGDILFFEAGVKRNGLPMSGDHASESLFYRDIRYTASVSEHRVTGRTRDPFLLLRAELSDRLHEGMDRAQASVAEALLTGDSNGIDEGLLDEIQSGGIAHIFAVSGLHIGILFGAVLLLFKKLGRKAYFPALAAAFLYTALCAFTVSSTRAFLMCAVLGGYRAIGRKYDFAQSISLAAIVVLLLSPADFLSAGFRLSFGACIGLCLFSGSLSRLFKKIRVPGFLAAYLAPNLSVQLFTFPILLESFGYFSVWGLLLNLFLLPVLPVIFLATLLFSLLSLMIPGSAAVLLVGPKALLSLFLLFFSLGDFSLVLKGFSLGMGTVVWLISAVLLSERYRMKRGLRLGAAVLFACLFTLCVLFENVVFSGGRIYGYRCDRGACALIRTRGEAVLVIDGGIGVSDLEDFLSRRYGGELDGVFVLSEEELDGIDHAIFLPAKAVYARDEVATGLAASPVRFGREAQIGGLSFRFEGRDKLSLSAEGVVVEFDFANLPALGADLFVGAESGGLIFSFEHGIIKAL